MKDAPNFTITKVEAVRSISKHQFHSAGLEYCSIWLNHHVALTSLKIENTWTHSWLSPIKWLHFFLNAESRTAGGHAKQENRKVSSFHHHKVYVFCRNHLANRRLTSAPLSSVEPFSKPACPQPINLTTTTKSWFVSIKICCTRLSLRFVRTMLPQTISNRKPIASLGKNATSLN